MNHRMTGLAAAMFAAAFASSAKDRPNVVVIVADDLGYGDLSCHGSEIRTPAIDGLFNEGIELLRYYVAPVSSPTRAGLMTGQYPDRFGLRRTVIPPWREYGLDENQRTMADVLADSGYENRAMIGKWHLGHGRLAYYPLNRGFNHYYGHLNGAIDYFTHEREGELDWHEEFESNYDKGYSTDLLAAEAVRCIDEYSRSDDPYFVYLAFNAPHSPFQAPDEEIYKLIPEDKFKSLKKKDQDGWRYRTMVTLLDRGVSNVLDAIDRSGEGDNTIVLFMSDNGGVPGMEPYSTNRPQRGTKFEEYEGGIRACAAIRWPEGFGRKARKLDQVTGYVDMLPTFADIVGYKQQKGENWDGVSVRKVLEGKKKPFDRDFWLGCGAAVNSTHKLILASDENRGRLKLDGDFFIDLRINPSEDTSIKCDDPKMEKRLREFIARYQSIVPTMEELDFGFGKKGFVAPKEWKVTKP